MSEIMGFCPEQFLPVNYSEFQQEKNAITCLEMGKPEGKFAFVEQRI